MLSFGMALHFVYNKAFSFSSTITTMFDFKHNIALATGDTVNLFGEDYFGDKSTFWAAHQTTLNGLYDKVVATGFPVTITDLQTEQIVVVEDLVDFHAWLKTHQPFDLER